LDKKNSGAKKKPLVKVHKQKDDKLYTYHVIDNPAKLTPEDWYRVVAVFAQGAAWQFKGWKWSTPVEIFTNVRGFSLCFDDVQPSSAILSWNVKVLSINKYRRHLDKTAMLEFWNELEEFLAKKKPDLLGFPRRG